MFGKKKDPLGKHIIKLEGEEWIDTFTIEPLGHFNQSGDMIIRNMRIICNIYDHNIYHDI